MRGDAVDLLRFPIPTWTPGGDAGAYLSAGAVVQKDPETGIQNVGVYRGMIKGRNRIGILVQPAKHSGVIFQKYAAANLPMPVAIVIGPPPYLGMTSVGRIPYGVDEISVAGALSGRPMEVVKCETVDLFVPAHCEMVIEGIVQPGVREKEGPFGEFYGHMGPPAQSPVIEVSAITYRNGTIHQGFQEQMPPSEGSCVKDIAMESILLSSLRGCGIPGVLDVYVHPMSCQSHVVVRIKPQFPSHAKAVFNGCWATYPNRAKQVIVVEDDCDIYERQRRGLAPGHSRAAGSRLHDLGKGHRPAARSLDAEGDGDLFRQGRDRRHAQARLSAALAAAAPDAARREGRLAGLWPAAPSRLLKRPSSRDVGKG